MFLGRVDAARAIYLQYAGYQKVQRDKSWKAVVLKDFAELRILGITHPLMGEIEKAFSLTDTPDASTRAAALPAGRDNSSI